MPENQFGLKVSERRDGACVVLASFSVEANKALIDSFDLGKTKQTCGICGSSGDFQTWKAVESYIGLRDEFVYFVCDECETLQIEEIPDNIQRYYPPMYYSFAPPAIEPVRLGAVCDNRMILDVGCGSGAWLCFLASIGCVNLRGCDLYIDKDLSYSNGVKIKKCDIHQMQGQYDVIHLSRSFEHLPEPDKVFQTFNRLLKYGKSENGEDPKIEIYTPVYPNAVFDIYGPFWCHIDAPRHFFIPSIKAIEMLANKHGFKITAAEHDVSGNQFIVSRMYQFNVPYVQCGQRLETDEEFKGLREQKGMFDILGKCAAFNKHSDQVKFIIRRG